MADQPASREGSLTARGPGSHPHARDTIAARATAVGPAAIAIVRLSGPRSLPIAEALAGRALAPRRVEHVTLRDGAAEVIDRGIAIAFPAPQSFTGEDVVELQVHGGPVVVDWLLETVYALGARPAEAGEFSLRAFLNDKLDLTQAEAIADLIGASSRAGARAAQRSLEGRFAAEVQALQAGLTEARVLIEAWLDFPDEALDRTGHDEIARRLVALGDDLAALQARAVGGVALTDGLSVAIAGPPNAGKSSLLNRLAGIDAAIVTATPGTTRDALRERLVLDGLPVEIVDTAGLRPTDDPVEREGVRRAREAVARADHLLWVADIRAGLDAALAGRAALAEALATRSPADCTVILNKVDLATGRGARSERDGLTVLELSALTGEGIGLLVQRLKSSAGLAESAAGTFSARRRHLEALGSVAGHLQTARGQVDSALELAAEELRQAQAALGILTGEFSSDDLLGEVFSSFCIGK